MVDPAVISVSAPGSLMLLGEHAVLHGHRALVCAINRRIRVDLEPLSFGMVCVDSALGRYESTLDNLVDDRSLRFVVQAIRQHVGRISSGFRLSIASGFSADIGFGSSAAVTVAVHAAILRWIEKIAPDPRILFDHALKTVHAVQGRGSGSDLAASVFGGIVGYSTAPLFDPVPVSLPLTAVYCGYKTPTPEVIRFVEEQRAGDPERFGRIFSEMDASVGDAVELLRRQDYAAFGLILNRNQELMDQMGVNTPELEWIVKMLQSASGMFGAKISGSGLGDCAIGVGHAELPPSGYPVYQLEVSESGVEYHV
ncbi:MAG: hypothetical protein JXR25_03845 [Pontiellaceae bacterium]|nr:hypothetical protein [Pontiellaceae bacterium]MBN2783934.1 hypothetical protein [Pontiellaceae bacterium]